MQYSLALVPGNSPVTMATGGKYSYSVYRRLIGKHINEADNNDKENHCLVKRRILIISSYHVISYYII